MKKRNLQENPNFLALLKYAIFLIRCSILWKFKYQRSCSILMSYVNYGWHWNLTFKDSFLTVNNFVFPLLVKQIIVLKRSIMDKQGWLKRKTFLRSKFCIDHFFYNASCCDSLSYRIEVVKDYYWQNDCIFNIRCLSISRPFVDYPRWFSSTGLLRSKLSCGCFAAARFRSWRQSHFFILGHYHSSSSIDINKNLRAQKCDFFFFLFYSKIHYTPSY